MKYHGAFLSYFLRNQFPRRVASNQKHPACGARTGACTMRKKHWEDRLIRAGSSHNGIPRAQWTQIARNHVSRRRFLRRAYSGYVRSTKPSRHPTSHSQLRCNFSLEKFCWKMFSHCTSLFFTNFEIKYIFKYQLSLSLKFHCNI